MKKSLLLLIVSFILLSTAKSNIKIPINNTGQGWSVGSNWGTGGVPASNDTVVIPNGFVLNVKGNIYNSVKPKLVIYIYGTLDFDPSGKIDLANFSEIHVHTGGSIKTNGSSSERILINNEIKYNGQLDGEINGPMFSDANTGESPNGFIPLFVLPVTYVQFSPHLKNNELQLFWTIINEAGINNYELEGRSPNYQWETLENYKLPQASIENIQNEHKLKLTINGRYDYRLKLKSDNGSVSFSKTISINFNQPKSSIKLFPNPAHSVLAVNYGMLLQKGHIILTNVSGKVIYELSLTPGVATNINVSHFPKGMYTLSLNSGNERFSEMFFIR